MKKNIPIPNPSHYGISSTRGFLSPEQPLTRFPNPYYAPWDTLCSSLPTLIKTPSEFQAQISQLPILTTQNLSTELEYRRAYVVLAFVIHGYVWCGNDGASDGPKGVVPPQLAEPFWVVCAWLGILPVVTYAGLCVWNWRRVEEVRDGEGDSKAEVGLELQLEDMDVLASFTGTRGEAAFYLIPVLTEYEGGALMHLLLHAIEVAAIRSDGWLEIVIKALNETSDAFVRMGKQMSKLYSLLDPQFFYHEHRPFMAGGKGMEEKGLLRGFVFQRADGTEVESKLVGGSAVQSALFPFLDYVLGIKHTDTTLFQEIRDYMPAAHRNFLTAVSHLASNTLNLRAVVIANQSSHPELRLSYDACLSQLRTWRGKHIALVSKYVVQPARAVEKAAKLEEGDGGMEGNEEWELQGTGGSALMPFLRQARDETVGVEI